MSRLTAEREKRLAGRWPRAAAFRAVRAPVMSPRRLATAGCAATGLLFVACACSGAPSPAGDPDPGHRALSALEQVLSVIPRART